MLSAPTRKPHVLQPRHRRSSYELVYHYVLGAHAVLFWVLLAANLEPLAADKRFCTKCAIRTTTVMHTYHYLRGADGPHDDGIRGNPMKPPFQALKVARVDSPSQAITNGCFTNLSSVVLPILLAADSVALTILIFEL